MEKEKVVPLVIATNKETSFNNDIKKLCVHEKWTTKNITPDADGIEDVVTIYYLCKQCDKHLATESHCISSNSLDVLDKDWGIRNNIQEYLN